MIKVNPSDKEALLKFFETFKGLNNYQLAVLADRSTSTIRGWKRKCGLAAKRKKSSRLKHKPNKKQKTLIKFTGDWDNKEWLEKTYREYGIQSIAKMVGKNPITIRKRFKKYDIAIIPFEERVKSKNECCSKEWLYYHYGDRDQYLKWCKENKVEPDENGGMGLSPIECAALAGVVKETVIDWLTRFKIRIRSRYDPRTKIKSYRKLTIEERRKKRRKSFELYRAGKTPFSIGAYLFYNGRCMGTRTSVDSKGPRDLRKTP